MRIAIVLVATVIASVSAFAAEPLQTQRSTNAARKAKPAWEWTTEERLATRFDPISIRERFDRAAAEGLVERVPQRGATDKVQANAEPRASNVVVGSHTPELFFPFELFPYFLRAAFDEDQVAREQGRERFAAIVGAFPDADQFWSAIEDAVGPYLLNQRQIDHLGEKLGTASQEERNAIQRELAAVQRLECALLSEAIAAAAKSVGRKNLYRVLYEGVAPGLNMTAREGELDASRIQFIAGGCK